MSPLRDSLRVGGLLERSAANGPGERFVMWVQGCPLACPGCFNPELQDSGGGTLISVRELVERIHAVSGLRGITLSGGEPLAQAEAVAALLSALKPEFDRVLFTGYTLGEILSDPLKARVMRLNDLVVAGRFVQKLASDASPWAGSSNKRVYEVTGRIRVGECPECRVEATIESNGSAFITGFPEDGWLEHIGQTS